MLMWFTLFYIIVVLQHLYFNNKTSSAPSSSINALKWLPDGSSLRIGFKISFDWSLNLSISPRRQLHLRSNNMITMRWKWLEMLPLFSFRYSCWEVCIAANRPFARWRHFTTTTRILQGFAFLFKLQLILLKPRWEYQI